MTSNISLSPHFCLDEFTKSSTAMKHSIKNTPPLEASGDEPESPSIL